MLHYQWLVVEPSSSSLLLVDWPGFVLLSRGSPTAKNNWSSVQVVSFTMETKLDIQCVGCNDGRFSVLLNHALMRKGLFG